MNVLVMCSSRFGHVFSAINAKSEYIAMGVKAAGGNVHILDTIRGVDEWTTCQEHLSTEGAPYVNFPQIRNCNVLQNLHYYEQYLLRYWEKGDVNHIIIGMEYMPIFILLTRYAKRLGYTTSTLFHEWHVGMQTKGIKSIHKYWQDYYFGKYVDGILPISHFLKTKCERFDKPTLLLPVLGKYDEIPDVPVEKRFTYCADAGYLLRNQLILYAFKIVSSTRPDIRLVLVLFGTKEDMQEVRNRVDELHICGKITLLSQISQSELKHLYASSLGLLIPLNPNSMQDVARFSQKIAEYVASGRPIITSEVGEVPYYFENRKNAIIAEYTPQAYARAMEYLVANPERATRIGYNGYETGVKNFDCYTNGIKLKSFICDNFGMTTIAG